MHFNTPPLARPLAHVVRLHIAVVALIAQIALIALRSGALAQSQLPPLTVEAQKAKAAKAASSAPADFEPVEAPADPAATPPGESLTTPTTAQSEALLARVPGSVVVVPDTAYKNSTPAVTIRDVLDYVPGVFVQPKWGEDTRLSIRGSGLSRNFHLRGVQLFMDGIPINTADGYGDFQEIDPSAYRYVEVYKGANALRYGANSLGGAINFVTPTGRDASLFGASADIGSFGFHRLQSSSGGVKGPFDFFVTGSWQEADGFRDHSWGIRPPRHIQDSRGGVNQAVASLTQDLRRRPAVDEIVAVTGLDPATVRECLASNDLYRLASIEALPAGGEGGGGEVRTVDFTASLGDVDDRLESVEDRMTLGPLIARLSQRERRLLALRFVLGWTQAQIARDIGVSQVQVSRLLTKVLSGLRESLEAA